MEDAGTSPWDAWSAVPDPQKQEVARLAKQGRRHPDPHVASAAERWAEVVVDSHEEDMSGGGRLLSIGATVIQFIAGWWGPDMDAAAERDQLRWAKRVLRAR